MTSSSLQTQNEKSASAIALLRAMQFGGVKFLRYFTVDVCNNIRCKVKPVDQLLSTLTNEGSSSSSSSSSGLDYQVSIAEVCYGGLPSYADYMIDGTGLSARNVLTIQPDLNSFRNLPYASKSAIVMGNLVDQYTNEPSPFDTRGLLSKVIQDAAEKHNIAFVSIILFCRFIFNFTFKKTKEAMNSQSKNRN